MSNLHGVDLARVSEKVQANIRRPLPGWMKPTFLVCTVIGTLTFLILALGADPNRAWRIYHVNWLFWTGLAQAGVIFTAVVTTAKGRWATPLRRMSEASVAFLPVAFLLFLLSWLGRTQIYPWIAHPVTDVPVKMFWLRDWFMYARDAFALLVLFSFSIYFVYHGVRQDLADGKEKLPLRFRPLYDRITAGWHASEGFALSGETRATSAPVLIVVYAVVMSLIAFDTIMSLAPHWVSNLLGGFYFMGAWLAGLMTLALLAILWRKHFELEDVITLDHLQDLGKLCFGFTVFWAYLFFSQFLVIWYGNMPEETQFLFLRMGTPVWRGVSTAMVTLCFLVPFWGLIGIKPKRTPVIFGTFAVLSLMGLWLDRYVLVVPSLVQAPGHLPLGWQEVLITAGFFGIWGLCYLWFAERFPLVSPVLIRHHGERRKVSHTFGRHA
ncbi:MAG TPA: hypothetical protein VGI92_08585 [Gemmatimonadales bacterium]|jgi:hypothetical protein